MRRFSSGVIATMLLIGAIAGTHQPQAAAAPGYTIVELGTLGGASATPFDLNDRGQIVGFSRGSVGEGRGFLWAHGDMIDLGTTGEFTTSTALGINETGQVVGGLVGLPGSSGRTGAYVWEAGTMRLLDEMDVVAPSGVNALDINNEGQIVGIAYTVNRARGFVLDLDTGNVRLLEGTAGLESRADAINDDGAVVGIAYSSAPGATGPHAHLWEAGTTTDLGTLPGDSTSLANAVSNQGVVVGTSWAQQSSPSASRAFAWHAGAMEALPALGGMHSEANDVNDAGEIVGNSTTPSGEMRAVLWEGATVIDLNDLLPADSDVTLTDAWAINNRGQIAAQGSVPGVTGARAFLLTPTSTDQTPPTLALPSDLTVDATGPDGAAVTYEATATDDADPAPDLLCAPLSGAIFPIGASEVSCTASDASGNTSQGTFLVTVQGASEQINDLVELVESFNLQQGIANALDAKLDNAREALAATEDGDTETACDLLNAFANHVEAQSSKHLTHDQARQLLVAAEQIRAVLGCS